MDRERERERDRERQRERDRECYEDSVIKEELVRERERRMEL